MKRFSLIVVFALSVVMIFSSLAMAQELNVLYMAQAGYQPEDISQMTEVFEEITDRKVNVTYVKYDEMHDKVVTSAAVPKGTYDVVLEDLIWTAEFAEKGFVEPIDDRVTDTILEDIPKAVLDAFRYEGQLWAMPFLANFQLFFYNQEMIEQAGFDQAPKTLEEMVDQMKAMKEQGIVEYPWVDSWNQKEGLVCEYVWLTGSFGGDTFNEKGEPIFNKGAGLKALEFMKMLLDEGLANPQSLTSNETMAKDVFIASDAAFTTNWTFQYGAMKNPEESEVVDSGKMGLIPVAEDVTGKYQYNSSSVSGFQGAAVMANSQNKDLAWKYIRFITSPVVQRGYLVEMPVWKSVQNSSYAQQNFPTIKVKAKEIASVHHRPKVPNYPEVSSILQRYIHQCLEGKYQPKEALDRAVEEINNL
ncbi:MAG: extracellular solute-binding protein [Halanaerobiales bacterium]|nr:extracellular solute-binding protein [Halanaerobiales bacterium]